jgi:hypothetical protein
MLCFSGNENQSQRTSEGIEEEAIVLALQHCHTSIHGNCIQMPGMKRLGDDMRAQVILQPH